MAQTYDFDSLRKQPLAAYKVNKAFGKQYYRVPVRILFNNSGQCRTDRVRLVHVIARNATEAANYVRDEYSWRPETEVYAYGPRGGEVYRYVGWFSFVSSQLGLGPGPVSQQKLTGLDFA